MIVRVGTMFMGEVDAVGAQSVQTKFFVLGVPLVPIGSFYFTGPGRGFEIPLHGRSVVAGYARLGLGLGVLLLGLRVFIMSSWERDASDWASVVVAAVGFVASLVWLGRLSADEKARRAVLASRTGLSADPTILPPHVRSEIETSLRARLDAKEIPLRPDAWSVAATGDGPYRAAEAPSIDPGTFGDLYAYARYASVHDHAWRAALGPLWAKVKA